MLSSAVMLTKPTTRRTVLSRRDALTVEHHAAASALIATEALTLLAELPHGAVVGIYQAKGTEVETARIDAGAREHGLRVAYPRVVRGEQRLAFHEVLRDELVPSQFGLLEPAPSASRVALVDIAAFVVPGLAFDRRGGRLGWGKGYYDATLSAAPTALRIGVAFECQLVDEVPRDAHDVVLHYVVTEAAVYRGTGT